MIGLPQVRAWEIFFFFAFDEGERYLITWFFPRDWSCPAGIDRDASRFQGLDAILDRHT